MKGCLHENGGFYNATRWDEDVRRYTPHNFQLSFNQSAKLRKSNTISRYFFHYFLSMEQTFNTTNKSGED